MSNIQEFQEKIANPDGTISVIGNVLMKIPSGGKHTRNAQLKLPFFDGVPIISISIYAIDSLPFFNLIAGQPIEVMVVTDIVFEKQQTYLGCNITATNTRFSRETDIRFVCNYIVQGNPATS